MRGRYTQVLNPVQTAVLSVRTWPVVPDIMALGSVAESQLQAQWLHVHGSNQLASQQPWELVQHMDWLDPNSTGLAQPPSRAPDSPPRPGLQADLLHGQSSHEPLSAAPSCFGMAAPVVVPSAAAAAAAFSQELQHLPIAWPVNMDGQGRVVNKSAALTAACELHPPSASPPASRGPEHQTSSLAGSASPVGYLPRDIPEGCWDEQGPSEDAQRTAADAPVQRLGSAMHPGRGILAPIHASPQQHGMRVGQAGAGTTSRDAARNALDSMGLLDLDASVLMCLMPK